MNGEISTDGNCTKCHSADTMFAGYTDEKSGWGRWVCNKCKTAFWFNDADSD